jgi:hypothetical protein
MKNDLNLDRLIAFAERRLGRAPRYKSAVTEHLSLLRSHHSLNGYSQSVRLALTFLCFSSNLRMFVEDNDILGEFEFQRFYGFDPGPLLNLNLDNDFEMQSSLRRVLSPQGPRPYEKLESLIQLLRRVANSSLLGRNSWPVMSFVKRVFGHSVARLTKEFIRNDFISPLRRLEGTIYEVEAAELDRQILELVSEARSLLTRHIRRLGSNHRKVMEVEQALLELDKLFPANDLVRQKVLELARDDPRRTVSFHEMCRDYRDEVTQIWFDAASGYSGLRREDVVCLRGTGIEAAFVPRSMALLSLGDRYGDCTALKPHKQRNKRITNIHQTAYTWLLDPLYRILEVYSDGEGVLKAHILPLVIGDEVALVVDAIEVVPEFREPPSSTPAKVFQRSRVQFHSRRLYDQRFKILECLRFHVLRLADHMKIKTVLVDLYSNSQWIREWLSTHDLICYSLKSVTKPFGYEILSHVHKRWAPWESPEPFCMEIQAINPNLMDFGLRDGYKMAGVVSGGRSGNRLAIRGP